MPGNRGASAPAEGLSSGMRPPLSSSQSPLSSVSACGENCARSLAPPLPTARGAAGAPHRDIKKTALASACRRPTARRAALRPETNAPRPVEEKKALRRAPVQWPSARDGGRRIGASADFALPSGTLQSSARSRLPSRGRWCGGCRGARTYLTSFSFRAFRFATRFPGGRRGRCPHRPVEEAPSTTGQRQRKEKQDVSQTSPGQRSPQGPGVSVSDFYKEVPTFPRRRQEVCACADRPAEHFFFSTGRGAFSF